MKKVAVILILALMISAFIVPRNYKPGIHGSVEPPDAANRIWAVNGRDSVSGVQAGGKFSIDVKPGNWTLIVEAIKPYKNAVVEGILVLETQSTDAGVIRLQQ